MTLSPKLLAALAFLVAGGLSAVAAQTITRVLEDSSVEAVRDRLAADGLSFASALGDGLQVILEGEAPSEAARFEAISSAAAVVDGARVIDNLRVAEAEAIAPPDFAVEILRNDAGVSLIGLVPASTPRDEVAEEVAEAAEGQPVSDLLETADHPVPPGWDPALTFALEALAILPRAKISVAAGRVSIDAVSDSPEEKRRLESELSALAPEGVRLALAVSAPRPVIAPFTLRATLNGGLSGGGLTFDACSADTEDARDAILRAAAQAGATSRVDCRLGLGAPSPDWGAAVTEGLGALGALGGGTLTVSDADVTLVAAPGTDQTLFDRVAEDLGGALPPVFALEATNPAPAAATAPQGPPEFVATLSEEGAVRMRGRTEDARMAGLALAFAQARFGAEDVALATRPDPAGLPEGWSMRVLTGIEALSRLHDGAVTVTPDLVSVQGRTGQEAARDEIAARAIETLGADAALAIEVAYDEALDPLASLPSPEECLAKISSVTDAAKVTFEPGSATISAQGEPVIEAIAEILRACPDLRLRIAGYTDSQGREDSNLRLSGQRAEAVLSALRAERVPVAGFEAQGFGEASPIASNDTESGREANRRIEFTLLGGGPPAAAAHEGENGHGHGSAEAEAPPTAGSTPEPDQETAPSRPAMEQPDSPPLRPREVEANAREAAEEAGSESTEDAPEASEGGPDDPVSPEDAMAGIATEPEGPPAPPAPTTSGTARPAASPAVGPESAPDEAPDEASPAGPAVEADSGGVASGPATAEEEPGPPDAPDTASGGAAD